VKRNKQKKRKRRKRTTDDRAQRTAKNRLKNQKSTLCEVVATLRAVLLRKDNQVKVKNDENVVPKPVHPSSKEKQRTSQNPHNGTIACTHPVITDPQ
jgi:Mg-chelatase subunit ChlD